MIIISYCALSWGNELCFFLFLSSYLFMPWLCQQFFIATGSVWSLNLNKYVDVSLVKNMPWFSILRQTIHLVLPPLPGPRRFSPQPSPSPTWDASVCHIPYVCVSILHCSGSGPARTKSCQSVFLIPCVSARAFLEKQYQSMLTAQLQEIVHPFVLVDF